MAKTVNYFSRDFESFKTELINWAKTYFPDQFQYTNDASPDVMYFEACAYVGDVLSYYTDRNFNESFRTTAQARESLVRIANDFGYTQLGRTPASTQVVLSITVPYRVIQSVVVPDPDFLIAIEPGVQLKSDNGTNFEVLEEVNFADTRNRRLIPNYDNNNAVTSYVVEKFVVAVAGTTKLQRFFITEELAQPFLTITLSDPDVTEVLGIVPVSGLQYTAPVDSDFIDPDKAFFEVQNLLEKTKFAAVNTAQTQSLLNLNINPIVKQGINVPIPRRFIVRKDVNNVTSITFGNNIPSFQTYSSLLATTPTTAEELNYNQVLNNSDLGEVPAPNTTLFIKYRSGGGIETNTLEGQINTVGQKTYFPAPVSSNPNFISLLQATKQSLAVRNELPAVGGLEVPTEEEIRAKSGPIFKAQNRIVTYEDLTALLDTMPPQFGKPFRVSYEEIKPRVANLSQIENGVNTLLGELISETTYFGRQAKAQEITKFLSDLRTLPVVYDPITNQAVDLITYSNNILNAVADSGNTLWIGEKARLYILGIDEANQLLTLQKDSNGLWVSPNDVLKNNIKEFFKTKRVIGDWIDIVDGDIVNIQIEFTVLVDKKNKQQILISCLNKMKEYFTITNWHMGMPIFIANVSTALQEINGVINVVDLKFYNIFGVGPNSLDPNSNRVYSPQEIGRYRYNTTTQVGANNNRFLMASENNIIQGYNSMIFEVKYPESDIIGSSIS